MGPLNDAMMNLDGDNLKGKWGNCGELNDLMGKTGNWAPDDAMEH